MAFRNPNSDEENGVPLLKDSVDGCIEECRGKGGGWRSAYFIIVAEMAERFAFQGIGSNLITYLSGPLGESTATAAENVNTWFGTARLLPVFGGFVADSFLGRYRTIFASSVIYVLGLGLLTLSVMLPSDCQNTSCSGNYHFKVILFFFSLYLVALAQAGHRPCLQAFGADQFDENDLEESKMKSSFFNWWYCGLCLATLCTYLITSYIQDNINWGFGFGILFISISLAFIVLLLGTKTYRFSIRTNEKNPFWRIGKVFVAAIRNHRATLPAVALGEVSQQFKFLNKALLVVPNGAGEYAEVCSISDVEEAKAILRLVPIWTISLIYGIVLSQPATFYTKQGATIDRSVTPSFNIPPASLQSLMTLGIVVTVPIYERIFVPIARSFTGKPAGITTLQRIGTGMFLSVIHMVIAALIEMKRRHTAEEHGLVDQPNVTIPMSVCWLMPQYLICGVSEAFSMVGFQEFFYDQVPTELRSVGVSLYLSIFGVGGFLSSFLISAIEKATGGDGHPSWFANNLNRGHLDYFYWLLALLSAIGFLVYLHFAKSFIYRREIN